MLHGDTAFAASIGTIGLSDININGGTEIEPNLPDNDLIIVDDGGGGTNRNCIMSYKTYVGADSGAFFNC